MITANPFDVPGRFLRGNIHTHSTRSDGVLSPDAVCRHYEKAGYDFLCLSDHFLARFDFPVTDTSAFRNDRFTTLFGAELHAPENSQGELWHILACGLPLDFAPTGEDESGVALARRAADAGAFVGIAHPQWSSLTAEDGRALAGIAHAVEIHNTGCAIETARGDGTALLDCLLNEGHRLSGYAADDAHFRIRDYEGDWMMVKTESNEPDAILSAMKAGAYYSSQGPEIVTVECIETEVHIACSDAANIAIVGRGSRAENLNGSGLVEATLPLERFRDDWFRVVISDEAGKRAWSNPIWQGE